MKNAHPYEEVAYDLYPMALEGDPVGLGLILTLPKPVSLEQLLQECRNRLEGHNIRYFNPGINSVQKIALCGGSGGSLIEKAAEKRADIYISADFRYHDLDRARGFKMGLIDAGHDSTEWPGVINMYRLLERRVKEVDSQVKICLQKSSCKGWSHI